MDVRSGGLAPIVIVLAFAGTFAMASCSSAYGEYIVDVGDAASDGSADGSISGDGGKGFCEGRGASTVLCDDFTDKTHPGWQKTVMGQAGADPSEAFFISPPRAVEVHAPANNRGDVVSFFKSAMFSAEATFVRLEFDVRIEERTKMLRDIEILRLESNGAPLALVTQGDQTSYFTQRNMALGPVGSPFRVVEKTWVHLVLELRRTPGAGVLFASTVEGVKVTEGSIERFDPPLTLRLSALATTDSPTRVLFDNVIVRVD